MSKHTPGPWHIEVVHVTEGAYTICHGVNKHHDGPAGTVGKFYGSKEDATLIAALPELLAILKDPRSRYGWGNEAKEYFAALAKAEAS